MIRLLLGLSRPGDRAGFWLFIGCVVLVGIFQGLVIGCFLAVIYSLFRGDIPGAMSGCLWLLAGVLVNGGLQAFVTLRGFSEAMRVMAAMHQKLGDKLVTLSPLWFDATASSVASGVAVRGTLFVARAMMDLLVPLIINLTTPLTLALMCLGLDWRLGGILLAGVPFIWLAARWGGSVTLRGKCGCIRRPGKRTPVCWSLLITRWRCARPG
ncbi:ABC transporter ATP-binding protein [Shimwellia pseudoproteus]|uniref:ABC transporter ATP-binding protein n=1 Tax=Shimwellia pseudoproteus TaxID=570012 RepID=UPI0018EA53AA|nr:ABC transporter ATP-binding protein [Shimwellia pseudoproteus]MBJ3813668.1 ABC transporter ATP-binding protein [Shimwellia pseudoproteus]